ncbi:MAG: ABC transporter substrate-binding protein [Nostoc sp. DedQUE01]
MGDLSEMLYRQLDRYEWISLIISLILTVSIFLQVSINLSKFSQKYFCQFEKFDCPEQIISFGEKYLIHTDSKIKNENNRKKFQNYKGKGIEDFRKGDYFYAAENFNLAFQEFPEPETLIYQNNAEAAKLEHQYIQIAVSVPISHEKESDIAQEILRGVAQAQNEINSQGGINGKWLQVGIADDKNDPEFAKKVAHEAIKNEKIVAMVGHNASSISQVVAQEYEDRLVMITPTSYTLNLNNYDYIFKIVPNVNRLADKLKNYFLNTQSKHNLLICYDRQEPVSESFKESFASSVENYDRCDVSQPGFKAQKALLEAQQSSQTHANTLLLAASIKNIDSFINLVKANQGKLTLLSSSSLYTEKTLREGKNYAENMVIVTPWHPDAFPKNPVVESFVKNAQLQWKLEVNWRSAVAYDATKVIIEGLKKIPQELNIQELRQQLQKQVKNTKNLCGATGKVSFTLGKRNEPLAFIIKVVKDGKSDIGYKFQLDPSVKDNSIIESQCY